MDNNEDDAVILCVVGSPSEVSALIAILEKYVDKATTNFMFYIIYCGYDVLFEYSRSKNKKNNTLEVEKYLLEEEFKRHLPKPLSDKICVELAALFLKDVVLKEDFFAAKDSNKRRNKIIKEMLHHRFSENKAEEKTLEKKSRKKLM